MSSKTQKIIKEFRKLSPTIINEKWLEKYVIFCLEHDVNDKIKTKTASHHILPCAKTLPFKCYSNLIEHAWNKAELYYSDHYYAHYLLANAVNCIATLHAFTCMHFRDVEIGRLDEVELIPHGDFNIMWDERNKKLSEYFLEIIVVDGVEMTRAKYRSSKTVLSKDTLLTFSKRMRGDNNITKDPNVVKKIRKTKSTTFIDEKNLDTISAERAAETMKQETMGEDGNMTTIYAENGKKLSTTLLEIEENGHTRAYNKMQKVYKQMRNKGKWYIVKNIFDERYEEKLPAIEVRKISGNLEKLTKSNYLGSSTWGKNMLTKNGKAHLIGLYVEEIPSIHQ